MARRSVQIVYRALNALTASCGLGLFQLVVRPYFWFNPTSVTFQNLANSLVMFVSQRQNEPLTDKEAPIRGLHNFDAVT